VKGVKIDILKLEGYVLLNLLTQKEEGKFCSSSILKTSLQIKKISANERALLKNYIWREIPHFFDV